MDRKELTQTVKEMIAAPSCCQELKAAGEKMAQCGGYCGRKSRSSGAFAGNPGGCRHDRACH